MCAKETNSFSRGMAANNLNENATETSRFNVLFSDRYSLLTSRSEGPIILILPNHNFAFSFTGPRKEIGYQASHQISVEERVRV